jgi:hypothetical protein
MAKGTRIRWVNVARLAAGAIGCVALALGLPALLERPKPPPLPSDVGLSPSTLPRSGELRASQPEPKRGQRAAPQEHHAERKARTGRRNVRRPPGRRAAEPDPPPKQPSAPGLTPVAAPAPPSPAAAPVAPPPAPAPVYVPPPAPAVEASPQPPPPPAPQPTGAPTSSGPSEFEFER